ncbi:MAG: ABC transporter substrate-binding protein [Usitatibacter sp.]
MLHLLRIAATVLIALVAPLASAAKEREVAIGLQAAITSIDPHYHNLSPNNSLLLHIYEPLINRDPGGKLVPGLATSWKPIDDLTWEFKLRRNVKFHDGSPFSADDVVATYKRVPNVPNSPSSMATFVKPIVETKVVDPYTIVFKTAVPHVLLPSDLAGVYIIPKAIAEKAATEDFNSGKAAIGTGPYKFVEYIPNQRIVMKANYGYWGGEEPWDKLTFKILSNPAARVAALLSGDVQMIETVPTADIAKLSTDRNFALADKVTNRVIYVHLNQWNDKTVPFVTAKDGKALDRNPFKDARVRKALSMAINRDAIADRVMEKKAVPAGQLLPDSFFGTSRKLKPLKYDPEGAKKLLAQAGYPNGFALTIHGPNNRYINDDKIAQAIAQFYSRAGIEAKVETMPSSVYFTRATKGDFGYMLLGWGTESNEQGSSLRSLLATNDPAKGMGVTNRGHYSNPVLDKQITEALYTMDDKKREGMIQQAAETAMNDTALIPIHYEVSTWATAKGFRYSARTDQYTLARDLRPVAR